MEQRRFNRYASRSTMIVEGRDADGSGFVDTVRLVNVSGDGALFLSTRFDRYHAEQPLQLRIPLPMSGVMAGEMIGTGNVVRLHPAEFQGIMKGKTVGCVALTLDQALHFHQMPFETTPAVVGN